MARRLGPRGGRLVTLTSDLGSAYAAQMKAALIRGGVSPGQIVDLAPDLPAHGVREGAFLFREMARAFPRSSVHIAVVDPGVGGRRRAIAIKSRTGPWIVGPDNGLLMPLADELGVLRAYRIDRAKLRAVPAVGTTFDGRDLFAPAAALLARGGRASSLGPSVTPLPYVVPQPARTSGGACGRVLHVDRFGNLITNVPSRWVGTKVERLALTLGRARLRSVPWVTSYESLGAGALGVLGSSFGLVEIAVREGRAARRLGATVGATVELGWRAPPEARGEKANSVRPRKPR
ncbi:MAG: SAM-dependent chlorinase/fluorinase [Thermoplasmata archaeon]